MAPMQKPRSSAPHRHGHEAQRSFSTALRLSSAFAAGAPGSKRAAQELPEVRPPLEGTSGHICEHASPGALLPASTSRNPPGSASAFATSTHCLTIACLDLLRRQTNPRPTGLPVSRELPIVVAKPVPRLRSVKVCTPSRECLSGTRRWKYTYTAPASPAVVMCSFVTATSGACLVLDFERAARERGDRERGATKTCSACDQVALGGTEG